LDWGMPYNCWVSYEDNSDGLGEFTEFKEKGGWLETVEFRVLLV